MYWCLCGVWGGLEAGDVALWSTMPGHVAQEGARKGASLAGSLGKGNKTES